MDPIDENCLLSGPDKASSKAGRRVFQSFPDSVGLGVVRVSSATIRNLGAKDLEHGKHWPEGSVLHTCTNDTVHYDA